jgi:hypothetical protein
MAVAGSRRPVDACAARRRIVPVLTAALDTFVERLGVPEVLACNAGLIRFDCPESSTTSSTWPPLRSTCSVHSPGRRTSRRRWRLRGAAR